MRKHIEDIYNFSPLYEQGIVYAGYTDAEGYPAIKKVHFTLEKTGIMTIAKEDIEGIKGAIQIYVNPDNYPQMILSDNDFDRFIWIDAEQLAYFKGYFVNQGGKQHEKNH